jgi:hypothetical protein
MTDPFRTTEAREEGFCWVMLGNNPQPWPVGSYANIGTC